MELIKKARGKLNLPTLNANRQAYVMKILDQFDQEHINNPGRNFPLDLYLRYFFLNEKTKVDSLDREAIVDYVHHLMIWKGYLNAICRKPMTWQSRLTAFQSPDFFEQQSNEGLPVNVRLSFPEDLYKEIVKAHGPHVAEEICRAQNERAMMTVRTNTIKTTRDELIKAFKNNGWKVQPT